jgi:hypothetical protein
MWTGAEIAEAEAAQIAQAAAAELNRQAWEQFPVITSYEAFAALYYDLAQASVAESRRSGRSNSSWTATEHLASMREANPAFTQLFETEQRAAKAALEDEV